jgi:hypothetical protein
LISANGEKGNLSVSCDAAGCSRVFHGRLPTEVKALRRGVGGVDADVDPDFVMGDALVRRQARRRGWVTVVDGKGRDLCPGETS